MLWVYSRGKKVMVVRTTTKGRAKHYAIGTPQVCTLTTAQWLCSYAMLHYYIPWQVVYTSTRAGPPSMSHFNSANQEACVQLLHCSTAVCNIFVIPINTAPCTCTLQGWHWLAGSRSHLRVSLSGWICINREAVIKVARNVFLAIETAMPTDQIFKFQGCDPSLNKVLKSTESLVYAIAI